MSVLTLMLVLALLGLAAWAIVTLIPMPEGIRKLIIIVAVIVAVLYVLSAFGIGFPNMTIPRVK